MIISPTHRESFAGMHACSFTSGYMEIFLPRIITDDDSNILQDLITGCMLLSLIAVIVSSRLIFEHLRHFSQPVIQRKVIAILWMVHGHLQVAV